MCLDRFMCYITGKDVHTGKINPARKCSDKGLIIESKTLRIPYEMYFASHSKTWNNGGTCFIRETNDPAKYSFARAYLISKTQFEHVKKLEGPKYTRLIELEPIKNIEAFSFTCENEYEPAMPDKEYLDIVRKGLREAGLSDKKAKQYLYCKTLNCGR